MNTGFRFFLFVVCAIQVFFAIAFFFQWPFATQLWPFEGTTPLTFIFLSSIFAAAAASTIWAVASENYGALAGIGLDYLIILTPISILAFQIGARDGNSQMTLYGIICVIGALFGLGLFLWSVRIPMDRSRPMPALVRGSFVIFVIALLVVSGRLLLKVPNTIPWQITPDLSVVIGSIFLGAAAYFVYGLLRPVWVNTAGQLVGFLAYDLVLIVPFLLRLPTSPDQFRLGLIIYTVVVTYSGMLAVYYLFFHRARRIQAQSV